MREKINIERISLKQVIPLLIFVIISLVIGIKMCLLFWAQHISSSQLPFGIDVGRLMILISWPGIVFFLGMKIIFATLMKANGKFSKCLKIKFLLDHWCLGLAIYLTISVCSSVISITWFEQVVSANFSCVQREEIDRKHGY